MISIAIDGPSGAGKSTLARRLAGELGYVYVDTGALYRSIGLAVLRAKRDPACAADVIKTLPEIHLDLRHLAGVQHVFLNEEDVSEEIRKEPVSMAASHVAAVPAARDFLTETQRRMARENNVIMDGRDIGTVILPNAKVKIFLTASPEERARRRTNELREKGQQPVYAEVLADIIRRDDNDSHRAVAPLRQAEDAVLVDTSDLNFEQALKALKAVIVRGLD